MSAESKRALLVELRGRYERRRALVATLLPADPADLAKVSVMRSLFAELASLRRGIVVLERAVAADADQADAPTAEVDPRRAIPPGRSRDRL